MAMSGDLRFLSLCSGAGGLDVGLEMAGWKSVAQVEIDRDCCRTLEAINARSSRRTKVVHAGIETVDPRELRLSLGIARGELRLIAGGPPCQPFTTHGLRQTLSDERAGSVFPSYLGFIREFEPETLVIENVDEDIIRHESAWAKLLADGYVPLASQASAPTDAAAESSPAGKDR
jgi:DNA (cytosine-5)-methyltransferase 1